MDFAAELKKLLDAEDVPLRDPLSELAIAQATQIGNIHKQGSSISLQIEEIYDIIKESDENSKEVKAAAKREKILLGGAVAVADILDNLINYLHDSGADITMIAAERENALNSCGLERLGIVGERLDPKLHAVLSAEYSDLPLESVVKVLQSGYIYRGKVVRKASVIVSKGANDI